MYIGTTLMVCRNALKDINETWYASCIYRLSDQWAVGLMGCRTNGPSDKWVVGLLGGPRFLISLMYYSLVAFLVPGPCRANSKNM